MLQGAQAPGSSLHDSFVNGRMPGEADNRGIVLSLLNPIHNLIQRTSDRHVPLHFDRVLFGSVVCMSDRRFEQLPRGVLFFNDVAHVFRVTRKICSGSSLATRSPSSKGVRDASEPSGPTATILSFSSSPDAIRPVPCSQVTLRSEQSMEKIAQRFATFHPKCVQKSGYGR